MFQLFQVSRVGRFPTALGQQLKIAGYDLVEGLHLVHHADAPGQAAVVKAAGKVSQPGKVIDPPPQLSCDRSLKLTRGSCKAVSVVRLSSWLRLDDVAFETRIRYAGPALQILGKGQRHLVNIGGVYHSHSRAPALQGAISLDSRDYNESRFLRDRTNA